MKPFFKIIVSILFVAYAHGGFAASTHQAKVSSSSITSPDFHNSNVNIPFSPTGYSLIVYRYRHGIDENHFTIDQPAEVVMDIVQFKQITEPLVSSSNYFVSYSSLLPPPPDFLFHTSLRSPPSC